MCVSVCVCVSIKRIKISQSMSVSHEDISTESELCCLAGLPWRYKQNKQHFHRYSYANEGFVHRPDSDKKNIDLVSTFVMHLHYNSERASLQESTML